MKQITVKLNSGNDLDEDELVELIEGGLERVVVTQVVVKPMGYQQSEQDWTEEIK